jgi:hypothetical protein
LKTTSFIFCKPDSFGFSFTERHNGELRGSLANCDGRHRPPFSVQHFSHVPDGQMLVYKGVSSHLRLVLSVDCRELKGKTDSDCIRFLFANVPLQLLRFPKDWTLVKARCAWNNSSQLAQRSRQLASRGGPASRTQ